MAAPEVSADELDLLADLDAGLLEGEELRRAEALARTQRGRAALQALARVRGALAALPEPPVPAGLDAWVRSALRASSAAAPPPGVATGSAPGGQHAGRQPRRRGLPGRARAWAWTAAGAAAVVLAGSAVGTELIRPGADGAVTAASGGGVAESSDASGEAPSGNGQPEAAPPGTGERDSAGAGAAGGTPASGGAGADSTPDSAAGGPAEDARAPALGVPVLASGRDYRPAELPTAALDLVERTRRAHASPGRPGLGAGAAPQELVRLREPGELADCLTSLTGGTVRPLVVDLARLEGQPVLVAVLPGSEGQPVVQVAGPGCSPGDADRLLVLAP